MVLPTEIGRHVSAYRVSQYKSRHDASMRSDRCAENKLNNAPQMSTVIAARIGVLVRLPVQRTNLRTKVSDRDGSATVTVSSPRS